MKKLLAIIMAVLMCLCSLAACTDNTSDTVADIAAVKEQIITNLKIEGAMDVDSSRLLDLYGIEAADIVESQCFVTMDGVFPDEIIMVNAAGEEAAKRVQEKLGARLNEVKVQSQSYDPENYAIAQECEVLTDGNVVALFLSPDHVQMEEIFTNAPRVELVEG